MTTTTLTLPVLIEAVGSEEGLHHATTLRLSALRLHGPLDRLELVSCLHTLHLNDNCLTSLDGLELLSRLRYLDVSFNRLTSLQPCAALHQLQYLDARSNALAAVRAAEGALALPPTLRMLSLAGNPCCAAPDYRAQVLLLLPGLVELDRERVAAAAAVAPAPAGAAAAVPLVEGGGSLAAIAAGVLQRSKERQAADALPGQGLSGRE